MPGMPAVSMLYNIEEISHIKTHWEHFPATRTYLGASRNDLNNSLAMNSYYASLRVFNDIMSTVAVAQ